MIGKTTEEIPAEEITGFSASGIAGHLGTIRSVILPSNKRLLVIGARTHFYEGRGAQGFVRRVVHSVRTAAAAGAKTMVLTHGEFTLEGPAAQLAKDPRVMASYMGHGNVDPL